MGRVRRVFIIENDMLLFLAALNDFERSRLEFILDLMNQRHNKGRDDGEDENGELLLQLFDNLGENGDPLNRRADALHDAIVKLNGRHDCSVDILDIHGEFFGILWRDWLVLFLGGGCVRLNLVELVSMVASGKDTGGEFAEKSLKEARISHLAFIKSSFKLVNLILSQLIGYWRSISYDDIESVRI